MSPVGQLGTSRSSASPLMWVMTSPARLLRPRGVGVGPGDEDAVRLVVKGSPFGGDRFARQAEIGALRPAAFLDIGQLVADPDWREEGERAVAAVRLPGSRRPTTRPDRLKRPPPVCAAGRGAVGRMPRE